MVRRTLYKNYNVDNPQKSKEIREKTKQTNLDKYGFENVFQNKEIQTRYKETIQKQYRLNITNISQRNIKHFENYNSDYIKEHFIVDGFYDPHLVSEYFGVSWQCAKINKELWGIKEPTKFYSGKSIAETELFESINVENKIHNDRNLINPYELDIVLPDYKIAIEYNGMYWHSDKFRDENYHLNKTLMCKDKGYQLFHIFEFENLEIWKSIINDKLGLNKKIDANDCIISEVSEDLAKYFCTQNSLQCYADSTVILGLYHDNRLMQIMAFKRKGDSYIISNFCTEKGYHIVKGADKLFKYFLEHYKTESVIAYADIRYSDGSEYVNLGFKQIDQTEPNVYSVDDFIMFDCGNLIYLYQR